RSRHSAVRSSMSRVVPATGATIDRRVPVMRLKSVDLPTFGRPTSTTAGPSGDLAIERAYIDCNSATGHAASSAGASRRRSPSISTGVTDSPVSTFRNTAEESVDGGRTDAPLHADPGGSTPCRAINGPANRGATTMTVVD